MGNTVSIDVQISTELQRSIDALSVQSGQSLALIAEDALRHYLAWRAPQQADLLEAISAADRGEFASEAEVNALFTRYGAPA
jgi:predicted transcriptional regulator